MSCIFLQSIADADAYRKEILCYPGVGLRGCSEELRGGSVQYERPFSGTPSATSVEHTMWGESY